LLYFCLLSFFLSSFLYFFIHSSMVPFCFHRQSTDIPKIMHDYKIYS
jgi:hypothetical protein